jgi:glycerol kinase
LRLRIRDNGGVYFVPAFAGLGAPWWHSDVKAAIFGLTLGSTKAHLLRAALESIAYQVNDLVSAMTKRAGVKLKEMRVDGGPTKDRFLMQFQADLLRAAIVRSDIEEASALGAVIMNGFALHRWNSFEEVAAHRKCDAPVVPQDNEAEMQQLYAGWHQAVNQLIK